MWRLCPVLPRKLGRTSRLTNCVHVLLLAVVSLCLRQAVILHYAYYLILSTVIRAQALLLVIDVELSESLRVSLLILGKIVQ